MASYLPISWLTLPRIMHSNLLYQLAYGWPCQVQWPLLLYLSVGLHGPWPLVNISFLWTALPGTMASYLPISWLTWPRIMYINLLYQLAYGRPCQVQWPLLLYLSVGLHGPWSCIATSCKYHVACGRLCQVQWPLLLYLSIGVGPWVLLYIYFFPFYHFYHFYD